MSTGPFRWIWIFGLLTILASSESACPCEVPTPCLADTASKNSHSTCSVPVLSDLMRCPKGTRDCRDSKQVLCEETSDAQAGFCCWTACSSLAVLRKCGPEPRGFDFEKTGIRNAAECHDPFNVRERCCLRELHTMETIEPRSSQCPKEGHELVALFDTVDGNGINPRNSAISAHEAMSSLQWLHARGYMFVADDFHKIDVNRNHQMSWYELQLFCGHTGEAIPADHLMEVRTSNILTILQNPLYIAALVSSLVLGEFLGLIQVIIQHIASACGISWQAHEGLVVKTVWIFLSQIWPLTYVVMMWWYFFFKIEWEVCDTDGHVYKHFIWMGMIASFSKGIQTFNWFRRRCPIRPSLDLERRAFLQQQAFRNWGKCLSGVFKLCMLLIAFGTLTRALLYGHLGLNIAFPSLQKCKQEDPDLALTIAVNEKFFLWNVFSSSFLVLYPLIALPSQDESYKPLPAEDFVAPYFLRNSDESRDYAERLEVAVKTETDKWSWLQ